MRESIMQFNMKYYTGSLKDQVEVIVIPSHVSYSYHMISLIHCQNHCQITAFVQRGLAPGCAIRLTPGRSNSEKSRIVCHANYQSKATCCTSSNLSCTRPCAIICEMALRRTRNDPSAQKTARQDNKGTVSAVGYYNLK